MGIINLKNRHIRIIQKYTTFEPNFFNISNQNNQIQITTRNKVKLKLFIILSITDIPDQVLFNS